MIEVIFILGFIAYGLFLWYVGNEVASKEREEL